jgi:succinate dehydrogenase / fumarate reductase flavoprotein subunit
VIGEANFSDHGANRLGASALMQGLADGYFVLPYTIGNYLADLLNKPVPDTVAPRVRRGPAEEEPTASSVARIGARAPDSFHRELGKIMWDYCGMARNATGLDRPIGDPGAARGVLKDLQRPGTADSSTRRSRRPAASPTSSSSAS